MGIAKGFHSFKAAEGIMEHARRGIEGKVCVGFYLGGVPAVRCVPRDGEHVVWGSRRRLACRSGVF